MTFYCLKTSSSKWCLSDKYSCSIIMHSYYLLKCAKVLLLTFRPGYVQWKCITWMLGSWFVCLCYGLQYVDRRYLTLDRETIDELLKNRPGAVVCVAGHIQTLYPARGNINRINKSFSRVLFALFFVCSPFFLPPGLPFQLCHKYSPPCPRWPQDPEKIPNQILFNFFKYSIAIYARI